MNTIPTYHFGFGYWNKHSTTDQIHRITGLIGKAYEEKKLCSAIFLDVAHVPQRTNAYIQKHIAKKYMEILEDHFNTSEIKAGVSQCSHL